MPTYDYECDKCGHAFEEFQSMSEEPLKKCPKCKKKALRRLLGTGAAIIFKGSGFYQTDYRSESYKSAARADAAAPAESSTPESKAETPAAAEKPAAEKPAASKPAAKSKTKP